jgi:hypothetical protein
VALSCTAEGQDGLNPDFLRSLWQGTARLPYSDRFPLPLLASTPPYPAIHPCCHEEESTLGNSSAEVHIDLVPAVDEGPVPSCSGPQKRANPGLHVMGDVVVRLCVWAGSLCWWLRGLRVLQ